MLNAAGQPAPPAEVARRAQTLPLASRRLRGDRMGPCSSWPSQPNCITCNNRASLAVAWSLESLFARPPCSSRSATPLWWASYLALEAPELQQNLAALREPIPGAFWDELKSRCLIDPAAPVPRG